MLLLHIRTWAAAAAGGAALAALHVPLAWMIGAMAATAAIAWQGRVAVHPAARPLALVVLGLAFGQTFSGPVLGALVGALPAVIAAALLSVLAGLAVMPVLRRGGQIDARSAYYAAVPGGVIVMAVLAQHAQANVAAVTLAQTIRVTLVVLTVPPLMTLLATHGGAHGGGGFAFAAARLPFAWWGIGAMLAVGLGAALLLRRTGIANPWLIGPFALALLAAATGHLPSAVPTPLLDAAQVAMGATLGQRLTRDFLLHAKRLAAASVVSSLLLCGICAALGFGLAAATGLPPAAVMLGLAPGGMPEMGVTAKALDVAVPLVMAFHLTRTLTCNFLLGPLARLLGLAGPPGRA